VAKKKITIIICSYNNSLYLKKCLSSVFNQSVSLDKFDVILVDDKSNDKSLEIANNFKNNKNLKIIKNYKNIGLVKSCNKAINISKTDFIVRVDSDDYISKNFIKVFLKHIEKGYDFIFSNYKLIKKNKIKKVNIKKFRLKNLISCSVALKLKIINKIGGYKNFLWEEHDLYLRYLKKTNKIFRVKEYLYFYRFHESNMTKSSLWKKRAWEELYKKYKKKDIKNLEEKMNLTQN
jgi:glycosyltransferase involved in cell wall biosynthesis